MIKRHLLPILEEHLKNPEISLITGPRQAGKTTLMRELQEKLKTQGEKTLFMSLDDDKDKPFFQSQEALVRRVEIEFGKNRGFVFIDEIQRRENAGLFLKGIYDRNLPYKLIVSGSGSLELKEKIHESLVGRKRVFELKTVSFWEFADFKLDYRYTNRLQSFFNLDADTTSRLLEEYLNYGGYPKVILAQTLEEKRQTIAEIYRSYLEKDIEALLRVQKSESLTKLVRVLAEQSGKIINHAELSSTVGINVKTIKDYLWYLEKTFIIKRATPFFKNIRKEIIRAPVVYFVDLGLRNYAYGRFGVVELGPDGFLFQNFIHGLIEPYFDLTPSGLHFWRTQDKAEVDFVLESNREVMPLEVKYRLLNKPEVTRSLRSFINQYKPKHAFVIHLGDKFETQIGKTTAHFLPYWLIGADILNLWYSEKNGSFKESA